MGTMQMNKDWFPGKTEEDIAKVEERWDVIARPKQEGEEFGVADPQRIACYSEYAEEYDQVTHAMEYKAATETAKNLHKYLKGNLDSRILDVASGTGIAIERLKEIADYNNVDSLDATASMQEIARKRGIYKNYINQFFKVGSGIEHNSYDALSCCAGYLTGHLQADTVKECCDIIKPGGYVVIAMRPSHFEYDEDLMKIRPFIQEMVDDEKIEMMEDYTFKDYVPGHDGLMLVFKKLSK